MFGGTSQADIWEKSTEAEGMQERCSEVGQRRLRGQQEASTEGWGVA